MWDKDVFNSNRKGRISVIQAKSAAYLCTVYSQRVYHVYLLTRPLGRRTTVFSLSLSKVQLFAGLFQPWGTDCCSHLCSCELLELACLCKQNPRVLWGTRWRGHCCDFLCAVAKPFFPQGAGASFWGNQRCPEQHCVISNSFSEEETAITWITWILLCRIHACPKCWSKVSATYLDSYQNVKLYQHFRSSYLKLPCYREEILSIAIWWPV